MSYRCTSILLAALLPGAVLVHPGPARADCQLMFECCMQLLAAHEERGGVTPRRRLEAVQTCHVYEGLSQAPAIQAMFCFEAWQITSEAAWADFQAGRIGFYPQSCIEDPLQDPDEVLAPPLDVLEAEDDPETDPEADPEAGE